MTRAGTMTGVGSPVRRQNVVFSAILIVVLLFGVRLVYVQVIAGPALAQSAREERTHTQTIPAPRGDVLDAHGTLLATSADKGAVRDLSKLD